MLKFLQRFFHKPHQFGIIAARVTKIDPHPNADRVRVITLTDGEKPIWPVVCGAFNFKEGDIVALALPGTVIPRGIHTENHEPFTLEKATIRGVESQGMICSAFELGQSEDLAREIIVLPQDTPLGTIVA